MRPVLFVLIIIAIPIFSTYSATLKVPSQYPTIQDAIDAAVNGDTVLVAPGLYRENITFKGKAITVKSSEGPVLTVIDGMKKGSVISFVEFEGPDSIIEGFTITNGWGTEIGVPPFSTLYGGGIYCEGASPTIRGNIIDDNYADRGGGIGCRSSSHAQIIDNIIRNNWITHGAGVYCRDSSLILEGNMIHANLAQGHGGGIYCYSCPLLEIRDNRIVNNTAYDRGGGLYIYVVDSAIIEGNLIAGNFSGSDGGGMLLDSYSSILTNNLILENIADRGAGIYCPDDCETIITNNTISKNTASDSGGGFNCWHQCKTLVANTVWWENDALAGKEIWIGYSGSHISSMSISHSIVQGGKQSVFVAPGCTLDWGPGMIDSDPLFVDPASNDFHLTFNSPCRASGTNNAPGTPGTDFEGDPRIAYGTVDMGADEFYTHLYYTGNATPSGNVEVKLVGLPGTTPVGLCIGTGVLEPPIPSIWGYWYLAFPIIGPIDLGKIPSPDGVLVLPGTLPGTFPPPYSIPMQALIGAELSNLCVLEVH